MKLAAPDGKEVYALLHKSGAIAWQSDSLSNISAAYPFSEGLSAVCYLPEGGEERLFGYIDKKFNIVIAARFESARPFSEGLAAVSLPPEKGRGLPGRWGFIDKSGKFVVGPKYAGVGDFSEGRAAVWIGYSWNDLWGFIDKKGKTAADALYDEALPLSEGLAAVRKNGMWGYIDRQRG